MSKLGEPSSAKRRFGKASNYELLIYDDSEDIFDYDDTDDILDYDDVMLKAADRTSISSALDTLDSVLSLGSVLRQILINFTLVGGCINSVHLKFFHLSGNLFPVLLDGDEHLARQGDGGEKEEEHRKEFV